MTEIRANLTHLERSCLRSIATGEPIESIAREFGECPQGIERMLESARLKLGATTNVEAIARAVKIGLIA